MELNLDFISKLYNNRNSYADVFEKEHLELLHIESDVEKMIEKFVDERRVVFLTGNPGDGKTYIINYLDKVKNVLSEKNTFVELDANRVKDYDEFIQKLDVAIKDERPCIIAINEYPLKELLDKLKNKYKEYYKAIENQRKQSIVYEKNTTYNKDKIVILDLNCRNLLVDNFLERSMKLMLELINTALEKDKKKKYVSNNHYALSLPKVQERLFEIFKLISNTGIHFVTRDIIGLFAYIFVNEDLLEGNNSGYYYNSLFNGNNNLFEVIKVFDPVNFTIPEIDEKLWNGEMTESWHFEYENIVLPRDIENIDEAKESFKALKRKFYFENEKGKELLKQMKESFYNFGNVLAMVQDRPEEIKKRIILGINKFFNPSDIDENELKIWTMHQYNFKNEPKTAISNRDIYYREIELLIPSLSEALVDMEYEPDHFMFRVSDKKQNIDLKIDFNFFKLLTQIEEGYPPQLIPQKYKFKIFKFINNLKKYSQNGKKNSFTIQDRTNNQKYEIAIMENKYIFK